MKYIKINHPGGKINNTIIHGTDDIYWVLVLDNINELVRYMNAEIENEGYYYCHLNNEIFELIRNNPEDVFMAVKDRTDMTEREKGIANMLASKVLSTPEGVKIHGIVELAERLNQKALAMAKYIEKYGSVIVKPQGGFSDMSGYFDTWGCEILAEKETKGGWPKDGEPLSVDTLILENAPVLDSQFYDKVRERYPEGSIGTLFHLKQTDEKYIFECCKKAKNICIATDALDYEQVTNMIQMFMALERKNVYIMTYGLGYDNITNHPLYKKAVYQHNIYIH